MYLSLEAQTWNLILLLLFSDAENVLLRMTIIGMVLRFRQISQEALHDVLIDRIPFLLSSILDFNEHAPNGESIVSQILVNCHIWFL